MVDSDIDADLFGGSDSSEGELEAPPDYIDKPDF